MNGDTVAMLVGVVAALFLAWRGLRGRGLSFEKTAIMAAAWVVIIAALVFIISRWGA